VKVPISWLRELVKIPKSVSISDLQEAFISLGFEVEGIEIFGDVTGDLLVGEVVSIKTLDQFKKPIRYCQVKIGQTTRGIVCGATNFEVGAKVVVALPGSTLPGGFEIQARKTYDHLSDGMICSEKELGISDGHEGILVLNKSVKTGTDAKQLLGLGEAVFDLSVLPDRGYALSMRGIAREIAAYFNLKFNDPVKLYSPVREKPRVTKAKIGATKHVSTFALVTLSDVDPQADTPEFIKQRLNQMGMRAISLPVDVTNYVMLEFGQPLHAFDRKLIKGAVSARFARAGEKIKTLDGVVRSLKESDLVIADEKRAISLAGVMGGENSEINSKTKQIVLEAATFDPATISTTARRLGLTSEASKRFERGVDYQLAQIAARRAAELLVKYGGGRILGASVKSKPVKNPTISLSFDQTRDVSGLAITNKQIIKTIEKIGARFSVNSKGLRVSVPSWRSDLEIENDLIEEVLRIFGYKYIPSRLPQAPSGKGLTKQQKLNRNIGRVMASLSSHEVLNYPFISESDLKKNMIESKDERANLVKLKNPLNDDVPYLRSFLLPGLMQTAQRNLSRGNFDFSIFEIGQVFIAHKKQRKLPEIGIGFAPKKIIQREIDSALPLSRNHIAVLNIGESVKSSWWGSGVNHSWITITQQLTNLMNQLGINFEIRKIAHAPWHPARAAEIVINGEVVGHVGELHPKTCQQYLLPDQVSAMEINMDLIHASSTGARKYQEIGKMPYALEDIAFLVDETVSAFKVQDSLKRAGGSVVESVNLFDVYTGEQLTKGKKSLAFRILLRAQDKTLTAEDLKLIRDRMIRRVSDDYQAVIRS
jgi:phenylalanyl-tRNA synthetase beta chain